jgi:hypothetical protein
MKSVTSTTCDTAMAAAEAGNAARAVAAPHGALTRTWRVRAIVLGDRMAGRLRIVRAIAAGVEMNLGGGSAHGAEGQREGDE